MVLAVLHPCAPSVLPSCTGAGGCAGGRGALSPLAPIPGESRQHSGCRSPGTFPVLTASAWALGRIYHLGRGPEGQLVFGLFPGIPVTTGSFSVPTLPWNMWELGSWSWDPPAGADSGQAALPAGALAPHHERCQRALCLHLQHGLCPALRARGHTAGWDHSARVFAVSPQHLASGRAPVPPVHPGVQRTGGEGWFGAPGGLLGFGGDGGFSIPGVP